MPSETSSRPVKTIILLGPSGSGKSTLLDGLMNHVIGVNWDDEYRVQLVNLTDEERERKKARYHVSQTQWVTAYAIPTDRNRMSYDLCVIDTPGFGDTRGVQQDELIVSQIKYLFQNPKHHGIDSIDGVCFVTQAALGRLTMTQRYIFDHILSFLGKDVAKNIFIMVTFSDPHKPPVIESLKAAEVPFVEFFKFNNSALFTGMEEKSEETRDSESEDDCEMDINEMYWKICMTSYRKFFTVLAKVESISLTLTKEVLQRWDHLQFIEVKIKESTQKMARIEQEKEVLNKIEQNINDNKDFEYEVDEEKMVKIPIEKGKYAANCSHCHETCHVNCSIADEKKKYRCSAMTDGKCTICTHKCDWSVHYNQGYVFKPVVKKVKCTFKKLKNALMQSKKEKINANL